MYKKKPFKKQIELLLGKLISKSKNMKLYKEFLDFDLLTEEIINEEPCSSSTPIRPLITETCWEDEIVW